MLPPVLEIYGIWHPLDAEGAAVIGEIADHFHGSACAGLLRGTVEVYRRSTGWAGPADAPRPMVLPGQAVPLGHAAPAAWVAAVLVIGTEMIDTAEDPEEPWRHYLEQLLACRDDPHFKLLTVLLPGTRLSAQTFVGKAFGRSQGAGQIDASRHRDPSDELRRRTRCRDLVQALAQWMEPRRPDHNPVLKVFISHTKHEGSPGEPVAELIEQVWDALQNTRLAVFYDSSSLQTGADWDDALRSEASRCALLALRTDKYSSRDWCQREMRLAKQHGQPVLILDALTQGEARGSFLMDHVPRVPVRRAEPATQEGRQPPPSPWCPQRIESAINQLVDAWLERVIWERQRELAQHLPQLADHWWAPQAPELATLSLWLTPTPPGQTQAPALLKASHLKILHPDPPLTDGEREVLDQFAALVGVQKLELTTPRLLAARGAGSPTRE